MDGQNFSPFYSTLSPEGAAAQKLDLGLNLDAPLTAHTVRASALRINTGFLIGRVSATRIFGLNADALIKETSGFLAGRVLKTQLFFSCELQLYKGFVRLLSVGYATFLKAENSSIMLE